MENDRTGMQQIIAQPLKLHYGVFAKKEKLRLWVALQGGAEGASSGALVCYHKVAFHIVAKPIGFAHFARGVFAF